MIKSFALIFILGLIFAKIFEAVRLPRLIGYLLCGIIIGPFCLNLLDENTLLISSDLRKIALVIILIKAGLTLDINDLKKVGRPAILLSFLPASFEILAYFIFAPIIFGISKSEAILIGTILSAVSPAVVVPKMVYLIENGYGKDKSIPQMILAGASLDDVYVIVLFSCFLSIETVGSFNVTSLLRIPSAIFFGILLGIVSGYLLNKIFKMFKVNDIRRLIILFGVSLLLMAIETILEEYIAVSGLLAVMACSMYLKNKGEPVNVLTSSFGSLWQGFEILLFVLVGSAVNINFALGYGFKTLFVILVALIIRILGVMLALLKTNLNLKERLFVSISYMPKATVQAAIGSIPLSFGLNCGNLALSIAVLAILITAPIGALGIDATYKRVLNKNSDL